MEKQGAPNAKDEIKKLQEALKRKTEDPSTGDGFTAKKTRAAAQKPAQESTKELKGEKN
jgi:hypothetical protein